MVLTIEWGNEEKTFIYTRFTPLWTWKDFNANREQYIEMVKSVDHRVDYVGDFTDAQLVPNQFFRNTKRMTDTRLENEGYIIIVNAGSIVQGVYIMLRRLIPALENYVIFVRKMDEALEIVKRNRDDKEIQS